MPTIQLLGLDVIADNACPSQMEIVEEEQKNGYKQIRFEFESEKGAVVPCYLLIPDTGKEKYPVAIVLQGHNEQGFASSVGNAYCHETLDYDTGRGQFAVQAVQNGYIALAIEQRGMGERSAQNSLQRRVSLSPRGGCYYEATTALMLGDLACLITPRKLAIIAGKYDTAFLINGVTRGYETVEKIYEKAGAKDNCRLVITDKGHFWCEAIVWETILNA